VVVYTIPEPVLVGLIEELTMPEPVLVGLIEELLLAELVPFPPPDLPGFFSNSNSSPMTPPSPWTYFHERAVELRTVSLLKP